MKESQSKIFAAKFGIKKLNVEELDATNINDDNLDVTLKKDLDNN